MIKSLSAAVMVAALAFTVPSGALANEDRPPGGFATWQALYAEQNRLNQIADTLHRPNEEGYAGIEAAPESHEVRLYWKGQLPAAVQAAVETGRATAPVRVLPATFSQREMLAEVQRWTATGRVTGAAPKPDGSGLWITVPDPASAGEPRLDGSTMPIDVTYDTAADTTAGTAATDNRQNDSAPHYAGARTLNAHSWNACSLGFAVYSPYYRDAYLTAAHCGKVSETVVDGGGNWFYDYVGYMSYAHASTDIGVIAYPNMQSAPYMYRGAPNSAASLPVAGARRNYVGNWVASSGASSGENYGVQVRKVHQYVNVGGGFYIGPVVVGEHYQWRCAGALADSGGPVFAYDTDFQRVFARGLVSSLSIASAPATCAGAFPNGSWRVNFVDVVDALGQTWILRTA